MYGESKPLRPCGDCLNMFEIIVTPFRTLANEAIVQRISYDSFRCCDVAVAYRAIRDTPYVRKPIRKGVRAVLSCDRATNALLRTCGVTFVLTAYV